MGSCIGDGGADSSSGKDKFEGIGGGVSLDLVPILMPGLYAYGIGGIQVRVRAVVCVLAIGLDEFLFSVQMGQSKCLLRRVLLCRLGSEFR